LSEGKSVNGPEGPETHLKPLAQFSVYMDAVREDR